MEPKGSLPHSQVPATCPYPEPTRSSPCTPPQLNSWISILILYSHLRLGLPSGSFPQVSPPKTCIISARPILATCTSHLFGPYLFTRIIICDKYRSLSSSLCSFLHSPVTSSLLGPNNLLSTLFSNTLRLRSSLNISDQVSNTYKTRGNIIVLQIFMFLDSKLEEKRFRTEW